MFLGMRTVMIPPAVSIPSESGVTSKRTHELIASLPSPFKIAA